MQTDKYVPNWQFDFGTQLNLAAVEANWRLAFDSSSAKDIAIVEAAAFVPEKRGVAPSHVNANLKVCLHSSKRGSALA